MTRLDGNQAQRLGALLSVLLSLVMANPEWNEGGMTHEDSSAAGPVELAP